MSKFEEREAFTIVSRGKKIFGILHLPVNSNNAPAIIFCQGFGGNKCGKAGLYVNLASQLAKEGYIVARFDYRGTGDSEGNISHLTLQDKIDDSILVLEFLKSDPRIDPNRLGIFGRSLGGAIAIKAAAAFKQIHTLVLWAPVFNGLQWLELWNNAKLNSQDPTVKSELMKLPGEIPNKEFLNQLFSLSLVDDLEMLKEVPLLHICGKKDSIVKIDHTLGYENTCKNFKLASFIQLSNTDHDFALSPDKPLAINHTLEWFKKNL